MNPELGKGCMSVCCVYFSRSSQRCSMKKVVLKNISKFTETTYARISFFNKVVGQRLWHRFFPVNFMKFLKTPFLQNTSGRLLLFFFKVAS